MSYFPAGASPRLYLLPRSASNGAWSLDVAACNALLEAQTSVITVFVYKTPDDMIDRISDDLGYIWVLSEPRHGCQRVSTTDEGGFDKFVSTFFGLPQLEKESCAESSHRKETSQARIIKR